MLTLYAIRNREGKYYHDRGGHYWWRKWTDEIEHAKIYKSLDSVRAQITRLSSNNLSDRFEIVRMDVSNIEYIFEEDRIRKAIRKSEKRRHGREEERRYFDSEYSSQSDRFRSE